MTADEMRAIVTDHKEEEQLGQDVMRILGESRALTAPLTVPASVYDPPAHAAHLHRGALLALLREIAERTAPRRGLLANVCPLCGATGNDKTQRHLIGCPALALEVLR